jgi:hypothetical protein
MWGRLSSPTPIDAACRSGAARRHPCSRYFAAAGTLISHCSVGADRACVRRARLGRFHLAAGERGRPRNRVWCGARGAFALPILTHPSPTASILL